MKKLYSNRIHVGGGNDGILICVLKDEQGGQTHTVGMNLKLGLFYDCMEQYELVLIIDNLSSCCGDGKKFRSFSLHAELKQKPLKKKKRKHDDKWW